jgi:aryl-alcohol dehydrogenase-like predicted oxidoreductase
MEKTVEYRSLGRSGLKVAALWLGTANFGREIDAAESFALMDQAHEAGITCIDTANAYGRGGAEEIVGRWLEERGARHDIILATKVWGTMGPGANDRGLSRRHIMDQVEASLRRLRTDHIDLYQAHSPDASTPLEETLRAFDDLVHSGKVRYIGCSNYPAWQVAKAGWISDRLGLYSFVSVQPRYNLLWREPEPEIFPMCQDLGLGAITFSPTAGGFLTGRYRRDSTIEPGSRFGTVAAYKQAYWKEEHFRLVDAFVAYARQRGVEPAGLAIAWVGSHPAVTAPIIGVRTRDQLQQALKSQEIRLTPAERVEIADLGKSTQEQ